MAVDNIVAIVANTATAIDVVGDDTDVENDTLTVSTPAIASGDTSGTVTTDGSKITFTPSTGVTGVTTISYTVTDDGTTNGVNDFLTDTGSLIVTVVAPSNSNPVAGDDTASTTEDSGQITIPVLTNDSDPDSDPLTVNTVVTSGTGTVSTNGTSVFYTPASDFNGTETLTYIVTDSVDGTDGSDIGSVTVTVTEVNDAPVAGADTGTITEDDGATAFTVLANDTDTESGTLTVSGPTIASGDTSGTVTTNGTTVTYTPSANFNGTTVINYTITDDGTTNGSNDFLTDTATLTVTVTEVNEAPVAGADTGTITEDDGATAFTVLGNDSDIDGDSLTVSNPTIASGDTSGTVTTNGTTVTYTPSANFNGTTVINYTITDDGTTNGSNDFLTATATLTVTVTEVNDAPVAVLIPGRSPRTTARLPLLCWPTIPTLRAVH